MTVESLINRSGPYIASGPSAVFPRNFLLLDPAHLRVVRVRDGIEMDLTSGITHSGVGGVNGTVTISAGIQSGDRITLIRSVPHVQRSDYSAQSSVPTDQVELDFDLMQMQVQDLAERQRRALTLPVDSSVDGEAAMRAALDAPRYATEAKEAAAQIVAGAAYLRALSDYGPFDVTTFGARLNGTTADTVALQAAFTAAAETGRGVRIPGGSLAIDGPVTLDLSNADESAERKPGLTGSGSGVSEIKGLNASAVVNVIGNNASGAGGHGHATLRGIKFTGLGIGLSVSRLAYMAYEDLFFLGKADGMVMEDVLSSRFWNYRWRWGSRQLTMKPNVVFSRPNALNLFGCHFGQAIEYGARNTGGANFAMYGGSVEKCGLTGTSGMEGGIRLEDMGAEGEMAADIRGVYFEGNGGISDITFVHGGSRALYNVSACSFNRIHGTKRTTHNVYLVTDTGDGPAQLNVMGCAFGDFNGFVPTAADRYIRVLDAAGVADLTTLGNTYETAAAAPNVQTGETMCEAVFGGTGSSIVTDGDKNVQSIEKVAAGRYKVNFRRPVPTLNRSVSVSLNGAGVGFVFAEDMNSVTINTVNMSGAQTDFGRVMLRVSI